MPRRPHRSLALPATLAFLVTLLVAASAAPQAARALSIRQREAAPTSAWSWFGDPRAVHYERAHRRTYVGWITRAGDIQVASYDHDTNERVVATLRQAFQIDDHDNPSLMVRPDGRLLALWSPHGGSQMYYRISINPEDVTSWGPEQVLGTNTPGTWGYTYPNVMRLTAEDERVWLFWRGGNFNPSFSTSDDWGESWAPATTLISMPGQRPYVKYATDGGDTIHLAFTQGHPRNLRTNIYYARYRAGSIEHADGSTIMPITSVPFTPAQADLVWDAAAHGGAKAWVHDVAADSAGRPVIVFASFPTDTDHRYQYARWTGTQWVIHQITPAGGTMSGDLNEINYSGGITLDHEDPSRVYLARQTGGIFEVEQWTTPDGGTTWTHRSVTSGSARGNYRPISPRGLADPDLDVVWMRGGYPSYSNFQTAVDAEALSPDVLRPAAAMEGGRVNVLANQTGDSVMAKSAGTNGWTGWRDLGLGPAGHRLGGPAVASMAAGRLDAFTVDQTTGRLLQRTRTGGTWGGWVDRGLGPAGHTLAWPSATSSAPGRLDVVARDVTTDQLLWWWYDGTWHGPTVAAPSLGVDFNYVPSITSWGPGRLDVMTVSNTGRIMQAFWSAGRWNTWRSLGLAPGSTAWQAPAAVTAWGSRRLDIFAATGGAKSLAHLWFDGTAWRGPEILAAGTGPDKPTLAGMGATSPGFRRLEVYSTDARRRGLLRTWFDGTAWRGPERLDFGGPNAIVQADQGRLLAPTTPDAVTGPIPINPRIRELPGD